MKNRPHKCIGDQISEEYSWWMNDGQGIPLCRVCGRCEAEKEKKYRPEILRPYSQEDVDEQIDDDY